MIDWKLVRYVLVGASTNLCTLGIYYGATLGAGLHHKSSLMLASGIGLLVAYHVNRTWVFRSRRGGALPLVRYGMGYLFSFIVQWLVLHLGVDLLGYPHQVTVLVGFFIAAAMFYVLQRVWVFDGKLTSE